MMNQPVYKIRRGALSRGWILLALFQAASAFTSSTTKRAFSSRSSHSTTTTTTSTTSLQYQFDNLHEEILSRVMPKSWVPNVRQKFGRPQSTGNTVLEEPPPAKQRAPRIQTIPADDFFSKAAQESRESESVSHYTIVEPHPQHAAAYQVVVESAPYKQQQQEFTAVHEQQYQEQYVDDAQPHQYLYDFLDDEEEELEEERYVEQPQYHQHRQHVREEKREATGSKKTAFHKEERAAATKDFMDAEFFADEHFATATKSGKKKAAAAAPSSSRASSRQQVILTDHEIMDQLFQSAARRIRNDAAIQESLGGQVRVERPFSSHFGSHLLKGLAVPRIELAFVVSGLRGEAVCWLVGSGPDEIQYLEVDFHGSTSSLHKDGGSSGGGVHFDPYHDSNVIDAEVVAYAHEENKNNRWVAHPAYY
jgi:hypothetical protein